MSPRSCNGLGVLSLALAGGDDQVGLDLLDGLAARAAAESK
jgi:hypothetical protein